MKIGKTPMEMVAMLGRVDVLKELIKNGADVNLASPGGKQKLVFLLCCFTMFFIFSISVFLRIVLKITGDTTKCFD